MGLKSLAQPLHFKAGAKQREQTSDQKHATLDGQENVDVAIKLGEVPEDGDAEKRAAEYETELAQKQKYVIEDRVLTPKRNWNEEYPAPKRNLHYAEDAERDEIRIAVTQKLPARIECDFAETRGAPAR